jgi:hypothetical protein
MQYPNYIEKQCCHSNCYETVKQQTIKCEILSGICYRSYPFLHTVLLIDDYILDFNYDLIMSKDLYMDLFNFEVISKIKSEDVLANLKLFDGNNKFVKENKITYGDVCFCYYELMQIFKNQQGEKQNNV